MVRITVSGFQNPGFVKDTGAYVSVPEAFDEVQNFRFNNRGAVSFGGYREAMSAAGFEPSWLKMFPPLENPSWVYASTTQVGMFNTAHHNISRIGSAYTGISRERWMGEMFAGVGIFNNTQDVPQAWLAFDETRLVDLPNWPAGLRCKFIRPFKQFLVAGNLTNSGVRQPYRVRWSHPADPGTVPASWVINDPAIDAGEFDIAETSDELIDGLELGNAFILYKQKTAHILRIVGGNNIMGRDQIISTKGLLWRDCVQPIPGGHFVAGADDIYIHTGQRGSEQSVVDNKLREWVFNQISADTYFNCFTVKWEKKNEIWFCFPESGEEFPNLALVYNTVTQGVGVKDIPSIPFMYPGPVSRGVNEDPTWGKEYYYLHSSQGVGATPGTMRASPAVLTGLVSVTPAPPVIDYSFNFTMNSNTDGVHIGYGTEPYVGVPFGSGTFNDSDFFNVGFLASTGAALGIILWHVDLEEIPLDLLDNYQLVIDGVGTYPISAAASITHDSDVSDIHIEWTTTDEIPNLAVVNASIELIP